MTHPKSFVVVSTPPRNKRTLALLAAPLLAALSAASASAQSVWSANASGDASGSWATAANWNPAAVPNSNSAIADFSQQNITAASTVTLDGAQTVSALIFGDTDTTTAATWTLAAGSSGTLTLATASGAPSITVNTSTAIISAPIAGTQGFTKLGSGTLALSGANTFTGGVTVTAGILTLSGVTASSTELGTNIVTLNGGAVLFNTASSTFSQGLVANSATSSTLTYNKGSNYFSPTSLTGSGQITLNQGTGASNTVTLTGDYTNFTGTLVLANKNFRFSSTTGAYNLTGGASTAWVLGDGAQLSSQGGTNFTQTYSLGSLSSTVSTSILSGGAVSGAGTLFYQIGSLNQDRTLRGLDCGWRDQNGPHQSRHRHAYALRYGFLQWCHQRQCRHAKSGGNFYRLHGDYRQCGSNVHGGDRFEPEWWFVAGGQWGHGEYPRRG
ncbi:MAG: autotransporter-associated beta strand repeat-containing protein [Chthoniobacteraceae bacterium]